MKLFSYLSTGSSLANSASNTPLTPSTPQSPRMNINFPDELNSNNISSIFSRLSPQENPLENQLPLGVKKGKKPPSPITMLTEPSSPSSENETLQKMKNLLRVFREVIDCSPFIPYDLSASSPETIENLHEEAFAFFDDADKASKISELILVNTQLEGTIPEEVAKLTNLTRLDLSLCTKVQKLPEWIGDLSELSYLDISNTAIKELPKTFLNLKNLKVFYYYKTDLILTPEIVTHLRDLKTTCDPSLPRDIPRLSENS